MKKLGIYFMMLAFVAVTFVGCKDDDPNPPVITMPTKIVINVDENLVVSMDPVMVSVNSPDEDLTAIEVYVQMGTFKYAVENVELEKKQTAWTKTYTLADFPVAEFGDVTGTLEFCIKATTANTEANGSAVIELNVAPPPPDELDGPLPFTWNRKGTHDATGLAQFGLDWPSNTATNIVIKPLPGAKLVVLTPNDWTAITTVAELEAAVDTGTGVTEWAVIPTKITFNHVIATKTAGGEYFLLNPTERTIVGEADRTITGQYKF